jgi:phage terminase large subunit
MRLALKACKGPGKTAVLSWIAWWFLATRPHPKIAATSISWDNLSDGLWTEMSKWQQKSDFLVKHFEWSKTRISCKAHPETWFMSARSWSKSASSDQQANTLAGLHADFILFILDESGGIPSSVMAAAEAALSTGIECKLIQAGNPTHLSGEHD